MKALMPLGILLIILGLGGAYASCTQLMRMSENPGVSAGPSPAAPGGNTQAQADRSNTGELLMGFMSGLAIAAGFAMLGIGKGNWKRPETVPGHQQNPFNKPNSMVGHGPGHPNEQTVEHPGEKPPTMGV